MTNNMSWRTTAIQYNSNESTRHQVHHLFYSSQLCQHNLDHLSNKIKKWSKLMHSVFEFFFGYVFSSVSVQCYRWLELRDFKSTTMTEMLSELNLRWASLTRWSATAFAGDDNVSFAKLLCRCRLRRRDATSPTSWFDITSHRPSLAKIKHSSSELRERKLISGTGIIQGLIYRSPEGIEGYSVN